MRRVSKLHDWINTYLQGAHISPKTRSDLYLNLKIAGFQNGIPAEKQRLARRIANCTLRESNGHVTRARTAAVIGANDKCPRCGMDMVDIKLAGNEQARYCQNPQCRVTCHIGG